MYLNKIIGVVKKIITIIKNQFSKKPQTYDLKTASFSIENLLSKIEIEQNKKKIIEADKIEMILELAEQANLNDNSKKQFLDKFNEKEKDFSRIEEEIIILKERLELLEFENERIIAVPTQLIIRKLIRDKLGGRNGIIDEPYHTVNKKFSDIVNGLSKSECKHLLWDGIINRKLQLTAHGFKTVYRFARDIGQAETTDEM